MMNQNTYRIAKNLPLSIQGRDVIDLATVVDGELAKINPDILLIYPNIDNLDDDLINHLAVQLHVDAFDSTAPLSIKRKQVKQSITLHKLKGTAYAVRTAVATAFVSAATEEWWQYGGEPYHFRVTLLTEKLEGNVTVDRLLDIINANKNVRSWLDYVQFERYLEGTLETGVCLSMNKEITITSDMQEDMNFDMPLRKFAALGIEREMTIHGELAGI